MKGLAKKIAIFVLIAVMPALLLKDSTSLGYSEVTVSVSNNLSVPIYKSVQFQVTLKDIPAKSNFALFDGEESIPLDVVSKNAGILTFKTLLNFKPLENKKLLLRYGSDVSQSINGFIFSPNFIGNTFIGIGSGSLYIVSLSNDSSVKVTDSLSKVLFSDSLNTNETRSIQLKDNTIFKIEASKPIVAEVSSLKPDYTSNSSDDISSVYGTYFKLFIQKEIFVSSIKATSLQIISDSGTIIFDGNLQDKGVFEDFSLKSGYYTISSQKPVLVEFGYADDNIYTVLYGSPSSLKLVSFGDIDISSLYPETSVIIKTETTSHTTTLKNAGDFYRINVVKIFSPEVTEHADVYITYSKPVLVYTDENFGNLGGEQIPSINDEGNSFIFRTGKVYNFEGLKRYTQVIVIAGNEDTNVTLNDEKFTLNSLNSKTFIFYNSFSLVNIASNKPVSVFEVGLGTKIEFLSALIPLNDNVLGVPVVNLITQTNPNNSNSNPEGSSSFPLFKNLWSSIPPAINRLWVSIKPMFNNFWSSTYSTLNRLWLSIPPAINRLWVSIKPTLQSSSAKIILLFNPLAQTLLPHLQKLLPSITTEQLSAIIFYTIILILLLLFILIFTKRKRQKNIITTVSIDEAKKTFDFDVRTIEEKTEEQPGPIFGEQSLVISKGPTEKEISLTAEEAKGLEELKPTTPQITEASLEDVEKEEEMQGKPGYSFSDKLNEKTTKENITEPEKLIVLPEEAQEKTEEGVNILQKNQEAKEKEPVSKDKVEEVLSSESSIDDTLKNKLEEQPKNTFLSDLHPKEEETLFSSNQQTPREFEVAQSTNRVLDRGFVADTVSVSRILASSFDEQYKKSLLSRIYISAQAKAFLGEKLIPDYTIGIIALTPIEQSIAEDLSKRIRGNSTTGEVLLIAKKIRLSDIVVSDKPLITSYQGITINNIDEIL